MTKEKALKLLGLYNAEGFISSKDIKTAYRQRAKETHPDVCDDKELFKQVKEAYQYLSTTYSEGLIVTNAHYDILDILTVVKVKG